jgi:Ca-activated chloride channel family protein
MKSIFRLRTTHLAIVFALGATSPFALHAEAAPSGLTMLVFDASGSMWGQLEDQHKIEIAREAVGNMIADWPSEMDLGLVAYGHRREGDCRDIEVVFPPQPLDPQTFQASVNQLNPRGKTPLTDAVVLAANQLDYLDQKSTVILLTDGLETCGRDLCQMATTLEERGIDFTAHVIGFDVAKEDDVLLSCLADNTGGLYIPATDLDDLTAALQDVSEATAIPDVTYDLGPASIAVPDFVIVGRTFIADWTGPKNPGDWLVVRDSQNGASFGGSPVGPADVGSPVEILAPQEVGTYTIFYEVSADHAPLASTVLNVVTVAASVSIPETAPAGSDMTVIWEGPGSAGDRILLIDPRTQDVLRSDTARAQDDGVAVLRTPETIGTFDVRLVNMAKETLATATFTTTPVAGSITLPDGPFLADARSMAVEWTGPRNTGDRLRVYPRGEDRSLSQRPVFGSAKSPINVSLPRDPGLYTIKLIGLDGMVWAEQDFEVVAGE